MLARERSPLAGLHIPALAAALALAGLACRAATGQPATNTAPPPRPTNTAAAATQTSAPIAASDTPAPAEPTPTPAPDPTETPDELTLLAFVRAGQLLVANVTGGVLGGVTQYTQQGVDDLVVDMAWSPSGEFIAYSSVAAGQQRVFVVYAEGAGQPVEIGPGGQVSWSPDSTRVAYLNEGNIWLSEIDSPDPRPLTFETDWAWGKPVFNPAGDALVVAGAPFTMMGASGNTEFWLSSLPLDGSGVLTPLPGLTSAMGGRLPYDLGFSPDGSRLAFSTSFHINACASSGAYYVVDADGANMQELISPSLAALLQPGREIYHFGYSFAWLPGSDGLVVNGLVRDCTDFAGDMVGPQQFSILTLAGEERQIIAGNYDTLSVARGGHLMAAALRSDDFSLISVHVLDMAGNLVLDVGEAEGPRLR